MKIVMLLTLAFLTACEFHTIDIKPKGSIEDSSPGNGENNSFSFEHLEDGELTDVDPDTWEILGEGDGG